MAGRCFSLILLLLVDGVFGADVVTLSVMEGTPVTLYTGVTKQQHDKMLWYFEDTRIALINGHPNTSCLYDGEGGRFRDRLKVDYESGSLTVTDVGSEHAGRYEAELITSESSGKRQRLNRNSKCDRAKITRKISSTSHDDTIKRFSVIITASLSDQDETKAEPHLEMQFDLSSGASAAAVAGVAVAVLLVCVAAVAAAIYYHHRRQWKLLKMEENTLNL